jgi:AraC-like DNA-binding protein
VAHIGAQDRNYASGGFRSHSHLCREFKTRCGVTPSQYRKSTG